jgi:hypothetical protein
LKLAHFARALQMPASHRHRQASGLCSPELGFPAGVC